MNRVFKRFRWSDATKWGWTCNSNWSGVGTSFNISIPVQEDIVLQGMIYNQKSKQIEVWGHYAPDKNIGSIYNDIQSPEGTSRNGRQPCYGGTDGKNEPNK
jgi:hypothetical protein